MPTDCDIFMATIAQQYKIPKHKLYAMKIAQVVKKEIAKLDASRPGGWTAQDFPWDVILNGDDKLKPDLLRPA